jgi:zinc protease
MRNRRSQRVVALMGWVMITTLPVWAAGAPRKTAGFSKPEIREWKLANGMNVVYVGVFKTPVVTVQVWYHAGSKDEPRDRRGSAHMFEHIMFKGTTRVPPEEHARLIDRLGGEVNAFTTEDMTAYHNTLPKEYLDFAMRLEAERMQNLLFRPEMIATEREVVKEEIRQRENHPIAKAFMRLRETAFTRHPYAWDAGGRIADLDATTPADLERFYRTYYQPNNASLIVVGDVSEEQVRLAADAFFGAIPRAADPPRPATEHPEPVQQAEHKEQVEPAQIGVLIGGYKIPAARSADLIPLQVLASILSDGDSSRLHQRVVRKDQAGVFTGVELMALEDPGLMLVFGVYLVPLQGDVVEADILDEAIKLRATVVGARELDKAKNQLATKFIVGLQEVSGLAFQIGDSLVKRGDARAWVTDYDRLMAVSVADIQRVAKSYLVPEQLTLVRIPPKGPRAAEGNQ